MRNRQLWLLVTALLVACDDGGAADPATAPDGATADAGAADAAPRLDAAPGLDGRAPDGAPPRDGAPPDGAPADAAPGDSATEDRGPDGGVGAADAGPDAAAASGPDAGPCAPPAAAAVEAPADTWTWIPIDGMRCANGQPTGIGVNLRPGATRLFIYLIGGGACWDHASCYQDERAAFIEEGFAAEAFGQLGLAQFWFFDRAAPQNPFADHHQVFVPYCTGDVHGGDRVADHGGRMTHHVGARNFTLLARRLAATFPDLERVVVAGGSAGGYGALFNWHRARAAFPCARVDLIDDAGAPIPSPPFAAARRALWSRAWDLASTLPADCPGCVDDWARLLAYNLERAPGARAALLTAMRDGVIADYMEVGGAAFERGVEQILASVPDPRFGAFLVRGDTHVLMAQPVVAGGQTVPQWLQAMQADDPAWGTVGPTPLPDCDTLADCGACAVCAAQGPCREQARPCEGLNGCIDAVVCALGCAAADSACIAGCGAAFGAGAEAVALYACVRCDTCSALCGACP